MKMLAIPSTPVPTPQTKAMLALGQNFKTIMHMMELSRHEIVMAGVQAKKTIRLAENLKKEDPKRTHALKGLPKSIETITGRIDRFQTLTLWQVVMLVTCVEAYLQDVLAASAGVDSEIMSKSEQCAPYADVIAAGSLEALANELRDRWARGWLSDGGPTRWISRLEKMGARGYPENLAPRMERFWGIRHIIVHAAGVATADFVKRHPGVVKAAGDRVLTNHHAFKRFLDAVVEFLNPTDRYFLARYPALLATSTAPAK